MDVHSSTQRSRNMAAIKASNTKPELYIRKILTEECFRYRLNRKDLPGKPDIVLTKFNTVIFIHGCFWHMHNCHLGKLPKSNISFWQDKLNSNKNRDLRNIQILKDLGWRVLVIWECAVKGKYKFTEELLKESIKNFLFNNDQYYEIFPTH